MRPWILTLTFAIPLALSACGGSKEPTAAGPDGSLPPEKPTDAEPPLGSIKAPGHLPVVSESELRAEDGARAACIEACGDKADCQQACFQKHPIRQVEVVPDPPKPQ